MAKVLKLKSRPVEVIAIKWTGKNKVQIKQFCGTWVSTGYPNGSIKVWNRLSRLWIVVKANEYIIKGTEGELYPCDGKVLIKKYEVLNGDS